VGATAKSPWLTITQETIDRFADATGDHQWVHVDPGRAATEMPGGRTIAHGFLTLALIPQLLDQTWVLRNERQGWNYGIDKLRFVSPVPCASRIRLNVTLSGTEAWKEEGVKVSLSIAVEIEGAPRPAAVLTLMAVFIFNS
jgi:acyl dehydratase